MDGFLKMKGSDIKDTSTSNNQAFLQIVGEINDHFCRIPLSELWIEKKEQFLPVHTLTRKLCEHTQRLGLATSDCLLTCYVLTGCDTVSYPYRRGKRNAAHCAL